MDKDIHREFYRGIYYEDPETPIDELKKNIDLIIEYLPDLYNKLLTKSALLMSIHDMGDSYIESFVNDSSGSIYPKENLELVRQSISHYCDYLGNSISCEIENSIIDSIDNIEEKIRNKKHRFKRNSEGLNYYYE